jgi:hypothetical protein
MMKGKEDLHVTPTTTLALGVTRSRRFVPMARHQQVSRVLIGVMQHAREDPMRHQARHASVQGRQKTEKEELIVLMQMRWGLGVTPRKRHAQTARHQPACPVRIGATMHVQLRRM